MRLFVHLHDSIHQHSKRNAFFINDIFYTYADLGKCIAKIRKAIRANVSDNETVIGITANDDIETYATILALWFEGKAYVPLAPDTPKDRNVNIIRQACIKTLIDSSDKPLDITEKIIESKKLLAIPASDLPIKESSDNDLVYILFTSGTTGQPKGVPITRANLAGFVAGFNAMGVQVNENDKVLQMFDLTFDLSVMSYLIPLLNGSCIYTVPKIAIKYLCIYELMEEQEITVALMVPSILQNLRPYFKEIHLKQMKYSLFCGEALSSDVIIEWSKCIPNATIMNVYGPTEDTIFCTHYTYNKTTINKSHNGLLSIGKAMEGSITIIIDEQNKVLPFGNTGQLCLGGVQLTPGYWNNEEKNKEVFFIENNNGKKERFYKTGDLCKVDEDGDILYLGRLDYQVKVQGFRVELSEVEFHVKSFLKQTNAVAVAYTDRTGNEIGLIIESAPFNVIPLTNYIKTKMPGYMIPKQILFAAEFPLNSNGKTDRNKLKSLFKSI